MAVSDFLEVERQLQKRREQAESVRGADTPFRVEFRYPGKVKHWQYFITEAAAREADDASCSYGPTGRAIVRKPISRQIQQRGPRGGWKALAAG